MVSGQWSVVSKCEERRPVSVGYLLTTAHKGTSPCPPIKVFLVGNWLQVRVLLPLPQGPRGAQPKAENKTYRIGVISASIDGKPQKTNGHTWHFAQYFHPEINLPAIKKYLDPGSAMFFEKYLRNPRYRFDQLPFPDTRITHVYSNPADGLTNYVEAFPGVKIAKTVEELVDSVDAVWLGDASGKGNDHYELIEAALKKGLPTFCDKPIGETVAGTRKILDLAKKTGTPLMSSSLFRHEFGHGAGTADVRFGRVWANPICAGEHGRRLFSPELVYLRSASHLDGSDALRCGCGGREHVCPRGNRSCSCYLQGPNAGRGLVWPAGHVGAILSYDGLFHQTGLPIYSGDRR